MWQSIIVILIILGSLVGLGGLTFSWDYHRVGHVQHWWQPKLAQYTTTPTLFIHGYRGNRYSFGHLLGRLQKMGLAKKTLVVKVSKRGELTFSGLSRLSAVNPTIQVLFANNHADVQVQVGWLQQIMATLQADYDVEAVNLVGHSMGAITVLRYLLVPQVIPVQQVILMAAPVNDPSIGPDTDRVFWSELTQRGPIRKTKNYQYLAQRVTQFPPDLAILNIAGELLGTNRHDGSVAVDSSFALRSLLKDRVTAYQEMLVRGPGGAHSMLHENRLVDQAICDFLWTRHGE
ncbi:alpha/beta fold hydrolase [Latilactobacillus fuchuensis]|uniref:alpha/beta fold hydrolase n=1 Tax=Latilactobacillus fuchuensis TaxID=164393 RepID=UPI0020C80AA5|nr:alpha/beta fold hydrolase [Latilactobacillus fuchuensis]MCP8858264.1 alpha/beta hydrolase [Latilactobacillus fuchuensis]